MLSTLQLAWKFRKFGAAALAAIVILLTLNHWNGLHLQNSSLKEENKALTLALQSEQKIVEAQRQAIGEWQRSQATLQESIREMAEVSATARSMVNRLDETFDSHDLEKLAAAKPGLIERRINDGSDRARLLLECSSGARHENCP